MEDLGQQKLPARRLVTALAQDGWRVTLASADGEALAGLLAGVREHSPRLLVFSVLFAGLLREYLALAPALRDAGCGAHLSMAGALPTLMPAGLLAACPALDSVLCGEAEGAISALARWALEPERWAEVSGLAFRRGGAVQRNPLPSTKGRWYLPAWPEGPATAAEGYRFVTVEGSRGCYHGCSFCLRRASRADIGGPLYLLRPLNDLLDEMEAHYQLGVRLYLFDDEQFLPPANRRARARRVTALERGLDRRNLRVAFTIKCRPDDVEPALFARLRRLGLVRAYVGVEAGSAETLKRLGKGFRPADSLRALAALADLGIVADVRCLLFHPWTTWELLGEELAFWRGAAPYLPAGLRFHELEVYPGTPLAAQLASCGRLQGEPWSPTYTTAHPRVEGLRRLSRRFFGAGSAWHQVLDSLSRAWFDLCVQERLSGGYLGGARERLHTIARALNAAALMVWDEAMLASGRGGGASTGLVENGGEWERRLRHAAAAAGAALAMSAGLGKG
ncbi:MAG: B12-binding domain-containing radical SAM protein [Anaerolineae bacterium]